MIKIKDTNQNYEHFREEYILCSIHYIQKMKEFCSVKNNYSFYSVYALFAENIDFFSEFNNSDIKQIVSISLKKLAESDEQQYKPTHIKNAIECLFLSELMDKGEIDIHKNDLRYSDSIHKMIQELLCFDDEKKLLELTQATLVFYFGKNAGNGSNNNPSTPREISDILECFYSTKTALDNQGYDKTYFSSAIISLLYSDYTLYGILDFYTEKIKEYSTFSSIRNYNFLKNYFSLNDENRKVDVIFQLIEEKVTAIINTIRETPLLYDTYVMLSDDTFDKIACKFKSSTLIDKFKTAVCGGCGKEYDKISPDESALKEKINYYIKKGENIERIVEILHNLADNYQDKAEKNEENSDVFQEIVDILNDVAHYYENE